MTSTNHIKLLYESGFKKSLIQLVLNGEIPEDLSVGQVHQLIVCSNLVYRKGEPLISDRLYDKLLGKLKLMCPNNNWFKNIEPEGSLSKIKKPLPKLMLSTDKSYSWEKIAIWLNRIKLICNKNNIEFESIQIKVTSKLDGFAIYDDGIDLVTRGDGTIGSVVTHILERGVTVKDNLRGLGPCELVINKNYFDTNLSHQFSNSRNVIASIIKKGELSELIIKAIDDESIVVYPFELLPSWIGNPKELFTNFYQLVDSYLNNCDYECDGIVLELTDDKLKELLGSNNRYHKWMIAYKQLTEVKLSKVLEISYKTGKSGKITPVLTIEPIKLGGVTISKVNAYNEDYLKTKNIKIGTEVEVVRSGNVIPKIYRVL